MTMIGIDSMNRVAAFVLLSTLSLAACSGNDSTATTGAPETMAIADLDATVRLAAQALLDAPDVEASTVYFAIDDPERVYRYDWMTARSNGNHITVSNDIDQNAATAFVQSANDRYNASEIGKESQPWARFGQALPPPEGTLPLLLATQMANGGVLAMDDDRDQVAVTRKEASDGSEVWRLTGSSDSGDAMVLVAEWIIDSEGTLWFYRSESDQAPLAGYAQTIVTRFSIPEEPSPIDPPLAGTRLDMESLNVPEDLIDLEDTKE